MKNLTKSLIVLIYIITLSSCNVNKKTAIVPMSDTTTFEDTYTIIWNGKSQAYRYIKDHYERDSTYDYIFSVVQKRYGSRWKSIKTLHRNHPKYNYKAGQRSQAMYFELDYSMLANTINISLNTSLGKGSGTTDKEFRDQSFIIDLKPFMPYYNIGKHTPYNKLKITQHYKYEEGVLLETVELYKEFNGKIIPFVKNEETASFYLKGQLDKAPTVFQNQ